MSFSKINLIKSKIICIGEFVVGELFILYGMILHFMNPGTILSELVSFCNIWILIGAIFLFLGTYRKNHQKSFIRALNHWQKIALACLVGAGATIAAVNLYFIRHPAVGASPDTKYVIILGGGIDKNGQLPKSVQNRIKLASDYLLQNKKAIVVVTGGTLYHLPPEAPEMKNYLISLGVEADRILIDDKALDTIQNFQNSCQVLAEHENLPKSAILDSDILVVTSFFHLARAQRLAHRMGFKHITGLGSPTAAIKLLDSYSREICSYIKLNLRILLTGKPAKIKD